MNANTFEFRDGVQLHKHVERDEYEMPSVVYEFTSERTEPTNVRVVESLPDPLDPRDLGFHREFEPENWTVRDGELVLEVELEPESEFKTVYAVRPGASTEPEELAATPDEFAVTPEREALLRGGKPASVSGSVATGGPDGPDGGSTSPDTPETEPQQATGPESIEEILAAEGDADGSTSPSASATGPDRDPGTSLVDRLVDELRSGRASEDSLDYLEQQFGAVDHESGSTEARLRQVQRDLADFRAYAAAMEEFLDEKGSATEVIDSFETRLEAVDDQLESLESAVGGQETDLAEIRGSVGDVRSEVESVAAETDALREDVGELSSEIARIDDQLPDYDVEERLSELETDLDEVSTFTGELRAALQESNTD